MTLSENSAPWLADYRADRDHVLLSRVRIMAALAMPPAVLLTVYMVAVDPASLQARAWLGGSFAAVLAAGWALSHLPAARRHGLSTALIAILGLVTVAARAWGSSPFDVAVAPINALTLILASTLLFPWGATPQGIVCAAVVLGYIQAVGAGAGAVSGYAMGALCAFSPVAVFGAHWIEGWRRAVFQRAWEQSQLLALAGDLNATLEADRIVEAALRHGEYLIGADTLSALRYDPQREVFRIVAERDTRPSDGSWVGVEFPAALDAAVEVVAREVLVLPRDLPESPVASVLRDAGVAECVYVLMRSAGQPVGALTFSRYRNEPFSDAECGLMRAVAHQVAQALRNAELVAALRQANALKSEFVSTMSHELRTPLNVIIGFTEMLGDEGLSGPERRDCLGRMDAAARDLLGLIESTLEIGKLEADRGRVRTEWVDLADYWSELEAACRRLPRSEAVALCWSPVLAGVRVQTDTRKLTVIVRNLVGNALKFTSTGAVNVQLVVEPDALILQVADSGIGVRKQDQAVIFEMFRQADGSDARHHGGSGLGLYIVRRFAEQLGGSVALASERGAGARFTVRLPTGTSTRETARAA